jgi:hypothetical protein
MSAVAITLAPKYGQFGSNDGIRLEALGYFAQYSLILSGLESTLGFPWKKAPFAGKSESRVL